MIQCGIVGWKNSGKTFLANKLIEYFSKKNLIVASIKHAHHDFNIDKPGTDSYLHRQAGSQQIIVSSSKRWAKIVELKYRSEKKLYELVKELDSPDIVIIEGLIPHYDCGLKKSFGPLEIILPVYQSWDKNQFISDQDWLIDRMRFSLNISSFNFRDIF